MENKTIYLQIVNRFIRGNRLFFLIIFILTSIAGSQNYLAMAYQLENGGAKTVQRRIFVWHDQNLNGLQDEKPLVGINGVSIKIFWAEDAPSMATPDEATPVATGITANDGAGNPGYLQFDDLPAGDYFVQFDLATVPIGYQPTISNAGNDESLDSDADPVTGVTSALALYSSGSADSAFALGLNRLPDLMLTQTDGGASAASGTTIRYTLSFDNLGDFEAENVVISAIVPDYSYFVEGSSTAGWQCIDRSPAGTPCVYSIERVAAQGTGSIIFAVEVDGLLPADVSEITSNTFITIHGSRSGELTEVILTNNRGEDVTPLAARNEPPEQPAPTAIELLNFAFSSQPDSVLVEWQTGAEVGTVGFHIYRSTGSRRVGAVQVSDQMISSQGERGGYYTFTDLSVLPGIAYSYWLIEFEGEAQIHEYGPIRAMLHAADPANYTIFLPLINK